MKLKDKIKSYSFWVSLASAVILILKILGTRFGFTVDESMVSDLFTALCSVLVLLGIIVVPTGTVNTSPIKIPTENTPENNSVTPNQNTNSFVEQKVKNDIAFENNSVDLAQEIETKEVIQNNNQQIDKESSKASNDVENDSKSLFDNSNTLTTQEVFDDNFEENIKQSNIVNLNSAEDSFKPNNNDDLLTNNQTISKTTNLKEILNSEREKFSNNINEYILELQEEIRKAREQM